MLGTRCLMWKGMMKPLKDWLTAVFETHFNDSEVQYPGRYDITKTWYVLLIFSAIRSTLYVRAYRYSYRLRRTTWHKEWGIYTLEPDRVKLRAQMMATIDEIVETLDSRIK